MAEITQSEFFEIRTRQSLEDFRLLLTLLERDEEIVLVDDPSTEEDEEDDQSILEPVAEEPETEAQVASENLVSTPGPELSGLGLPLEPEASPVVDGAPEAAEGDQPPADGPASSHPSEPADSEQG